MCLKIIRIRQDRVQNSNIYTTHSAKAVKYTDCISEEG